MCGIGLTLLRDGECSCCQCVHGGNGEATATADQPSDKGGAALTPRQLHRCISDVLAHRGPDLTHQQYTVSSGFQFNDVCKHESVPSPSHSSYREEWTIWRNKSLSDAICTSSWHLTLLASVLHMRGEELTGQPYVLEDEDDLFVLCWNGEVYSYGKFDCDAMKSAIGNELLEPDELPLAEYDAAEEVDSFRSDTKDIMYIVSSAIKAMRGRQDHSMTQHEAVAESLSQICGEYSFILYHKRKCSEGSDDTNESIYYGRDPLGRRSLLVSRDESQPFNITLTSTSFDCNQVMEFSEVEAGRVFRIDLQSGNVTSFALARRLPALPSNIEHNEVYAKSLAEKGIPVSLVQASESLQMLLERAVRRRVVNSHKPRRGEASVGVLFSGGIDSVVLAALCDNHVPREEPIDLLNVAFTSTKNNISTSSSPDRAAALLSFQEMEMKFPHRKWRFVAVDIPYTEVLQNEEQICRLIAPLEKVMDFNIACAFWFASRGRGTILESKDVHNDVNKQEGSALLRFAPKSSEERSHSLSSENDQEEEAATANISANDIDTHKTPCGKSAPTLYESLARVLIIGIGADEQLAGYGRHRSVYNKGGYAALRDELQMERERLWTRNLGRDDRVVSDHGKEARFPFLDEDVVGFLQTLDVLDICDMERPQGEGDKLILRLIAKKIGVDKCSGLVKRAIQFGSRIAKCSDVDRFGSSRKAQGSSTHRQSSRNKKDYDQRC